MRYWYCTVIGYAEKVPDHSENSLKHGTMIPAQFSSVIPFTFRAVPIFTGLNKASSIDTVLFV
jgi:hypothetical protein